MKSKVSSVAACAALVLSTGIAVSSAVPASASASASASNPSCMSRAEYRAIKVGMPLTRVRAIVGASGKNAMQSSYMSIWQWSTCTNAYGVGTVTFLQGKVDNKSYIG